jgi:hypothetical protein
MLYIDGASMGMENSLKNPQKKLKTNLQNPKDGV